MPRRNIIKPDVADRFYHVYARGNNRQLLFRDPGDYAVFLNLFKRYLSERPSYDKTGYAYPHLYGDIELVCYCLMPNHFHMLIYQNQTGAMQQLMRALMTSYSRFFNVKYGRSGRLYESSYMAVLIDNIGYLRHITRYIHRNPEKWEGYLYSSLPYYFEEKHAAWLRPGRVTDLFDSKEQYRAYLRSYIGKKRVVM